MRAAQRAPFGTVAGEQVEQIELVNEQGMRLKVMNYGATLLELHVPDRNGVLENVVLGFTDLSRYVNDSPYFGATIGRVAGRIRDGRWGDTQLSQNEGAQHIHGGAHNVSHRVWLIETVTDTAVTMSLTLPEGDQGYPGTLTMRVTYALLADNQVSITTTGHSDTQTLFNPTNHSYFNLSGGLKETVSEHCIILAADKVAAVDETKCPTGVLVPVEGSAFDFRKGKTLTQFCVDEPAGLDTPFVLQEDSPSAVIVQDNVSGRQLRVATTAAAVVLFSTTGMNEDYLVNGTRPMCSQLGLAIEPQMLPDAIHHADFGNIVLEANETKGYRSIYTFDTI